MENHVPFKHRRTTLERAEKFISTHHFTDINLRSRLYPSREAVRSITHYAATGRISYDEAIKGTFKTAKLGQSFGPTWSTHWFRLEIEVPPDWVGQEVRLRWNSNSEALIWVDGEPRQGLSSEKDRSDFILSRRQEQGKLGYSVYVEMACNGLFGAGQNGMIMPTDPDCRFTLQQADIAIFDRDVYNLIMDMEILHGIAKELPDNERGYQALYAANSFVNVCDVKDKTTYHKARDISQKFFQQKNGESQHTIYAMGHAHIDTAWLWPYGETKRKCARSWSCTVRLMEQYSDFKFACSQAQQYAWVKEQYPSLYKDICKFVAKGQFVPVGGTWVEMDGYIPSGEAFVRQFLYGQRFFQKEFGIKCTEFWLPDTFGYAAQLPQIMQQCGIRYFVTQKLSWSLVNKFPHHSFWWQSLDCSRVLAHFPPGDSYNMEGQVKEHHTFWWEGMDGSRVLSHFPPGDSYHMEGQVKEALYTVNNFRDKGRSSRSMFLFGYGDGGNGPDEHMLQRLKRMEDVDGLPRIKMSTPREFFKTLEEQEGSKLCTWRGELYLEMHNGTYTTHAKVKERNRRCEFLLQEIEQLWALVFAFSKEYKMKGDYTKAVYPKDNVERLWKLLLLNQFHDVLPGSSITIVYDDAHAYYKEIEEEGAQLLNKAISFLGNALSEGSQKTSSMVVNTLSWQRLSIISLPSADMSQSAKKRKVQTQVDSEGITLVCVEVPSCSIGSLESSIKAVDENEFVHAEQQGEFIVLRNSQVEATLDTLGRLTSLRCAGSSRELLLDGYFGNQLLLFDDVPLYWDAWDVMDYHLETRKPLEQVIQKATLKESGPLRASVEVKIQISADSTVTQTIQLDAASPYVVFILKVEWHENRKFLKVEFPTNIHSMEATYEVQYGALQRPNHYNTSWDSAKFEVCGQKWADISEYGAGLSVLTDSKYGYSAIGGVLRISLLRSPKAPDAHADMGSHNFSYAVMPHKGSWQEAGVVQAAFNLNRPLRVLSLAESLALSSPRSCFWLNSSQVVLDTIKIAEDHDDVIIVRLYEAFGGQAIFCLSSSLSLQTVRRCSCLEEVSDEPYLPIRKDKDVTTIPLELRPFQILTLQLTL